MRSAARRAQARAGAALIPKAPLWAKARSSARLRRSGKSESGEVNRQEIYRGQGSGASVEQEVSRRPSPHSGEGVRQVRERFDLGAETPLTSAWRGH